MILEGEASASPFLHFAYNIYQKLYFLVKFYGFHRWDKKRFVILIKFCLVFLVLLSNPPYLLEMPDL